MRAIDTPVTDSQTSPKFQRATRHAQLLLKLWVLLSIGGVSLCAAAWRLPVWRTLLLDNAATFLVLSAGVQAAYWVVRWRVQAIQKAQLVSHDQLGDAAIAATPLQRTFTRINRWSSSLAFTVKQRSSAEGLAALCMGLLALIALWLIFKFWNWQLAPLLLGNQALMAGAAALLMSFGLLVLERYFATHLVNELPEAASLTLLLRVAITVTVLSCVCIGFGNGVRVWPMRLAVLIGIIPAVIAVEWLLRALLSVFSPQTPHEPEMLADSLIAGLWRWPLRPLHHLHNELQQRFGIDLRQNWAFAYIRRALLPVMSTLLVLAWLLSGIVEVPISQRGIYERFGEPVAVWQPGLHLGVPWPVARVRTVDNGIIHELAAASASDVDDAKRDAAEVTPATAEGAPPDSANRLWDASHVAEKSQVIASRADDRQSFHIVNMDVRFMYRIGLSDTAALQATYNSSDVPTLIRSTASRILVRYFASRTLDGVLGETRTQLAADVGAELQADLNTLNSGVEVLATVIEAIHPPAAAANAYHSVQAAQIGARAIIARERGSAAQQLNLAQLRAGMARNQAAAGARETIAIAEAAQLRFAAERTAYDRAGKAFLLEQYLGQLSHGLANAQLVIIDHRLRSVAPSIDLRTFAASSDTARKTEP